MKWEMRQSEMDRQDQLDMLDAYTPMQEKETARLEEAIEVAKRKLDDHLAFMDERAEFRQKLVESLK
jgi:hypothetical protein